MHRWKRWYPAADTLHTESACSAVDMGAALLEPACYRGVSNRVQQLAGRSTHPHIVADCCQAVATQAQEVRGPRGCNEQRLHRVQGLCIPVARQQ